MKTIVVESNYNGIPNKPQEKTRCIDITFTEDASIVPEFMLLDDEAYQKQFDVYDKILIDLISDKKRELFLVNIEKSIGSFNSIQKWKGIWWEGEKGKKRFANQSEEIIISNDDCYIMAAYAQIREDEINGFLKKWDYRLLCFSDNETMQKLFNQTSKILFKERDMIDYLLSFNAIILYFTSPGYEVSSLFMYGNEKDIEGLKQEINQVINKL